MQDFVYKTVLRLVRIYFLICAITKGLVFFLGKVSI